MQYGWHIYGLPVVCAVGGERGYFCLTIFAFLGMLLLIYEFTRKHSNIDGAFNGSLAALSAAFVICGFCRATVPNNDVPTLFVELVALLFAIEDVFHGNVRARSLTMGLLLGFLLSIKITVLPGVFLMSCILLFSVSRERRLASMAWMSAAAIPLAVVWPLNTFVNSGSPLPQHLMLLRFQGPPLPHFRETETLLNGYFAGWLESRYFRFFTGDMIGFRYLLYGCCAGLIALAWRRRWLEGNCVKIILFYGVLRMAILGAQGKVAFYHDRYHLVTYIIAGAFGAFGWNAMAKLVFRAREGLRRSFVVILLLVFCYPLIFMADAILDQTNALCQYFRQAPGINGHADMFAWIDKNVPRDARIAGNLIYYYPAHRHYLEMVAVSQDQIDLSLSPEVILRKLREVHATHLHISAYNHLPLEIADACFKWEKNLRRIPDLPGVKRLVTFGRWTDGGPSDALYELGN